MDDSTIIYKNMKDGNIFIFDRQGKARQKINRQGASGDEYVSPYSLCYDKEKKELYVNDLLNKKIFVYNMQGHYKRSFGHLPNTQYSSMIYSFNDRYLLCYNGTMNETLEEEKYPFKIVSKQTGQLIKELNIPFPKRIFSKFYHREGNNALMIMAYPSPQPAVKMGDEWIVNEVSSDTIYQLSKNFSLTPVMVQTPSVRTMGENLKYLSFVMDSYYYQFMFIQKKEFDKKTQTGFPTTLIMYDKKTGKLFEQNFYDANRPNEVFEFSCNDTQMAESNQYCDYYLAPKLKKLLAKGELTGRLKEIAEKIDEDDNPVLMIVTFKK